ncbi:unnamed protein product [Pocillopora meandrina]|uniref:Trafficking protein particle complex subunit n=1 Tax=Pocillopora meandrina TaxID=46732 RepID=A0AAU9VQ48_9CNID|nr:unnamed protein product [Pocillopora meandrina]
MSRQSTVRADNRKVSAELFVLTHGALVAQLVKDYESDEEVNKQLDKIIEICLSNDSKKTLFVSKNKMEHCLFSMYFFLTHRPFISLRNFSLVSNKATKTLTTQKSIIWSKLRSLQSFGLRRWCTMLAALMFSCGLGSFPFLLETNNAFRVVTQTYFKGYNIGVRLVEDFLARSNVGRCHDFRETADVIAKLGFKMFLGISPVVTNWSAASDEFSLILDNNPMAEFAELPEGHEGLLFSNILCGVLRGALEMVQMEVDVWFVHDSLRGDETTEIRLKFIKKLEDALPAGED